MYVMLCSEQVFFSYVILSRPCFSRGTLNGWGGGLNSSNVRVYRLRKWGFALQLGTELNLNMSDVISSAILAANSASVNLEACVDENVSPQPNQNPETEDPKKEEAKNIVESTYSVVSAHWDLSANQHKNSVVILLKPYMLQMLDWPTLASINEVCREMYTTLKRNPESCGLWNAHCISFCSYRGLYSPYLRDMEPKSIADIEKTRTADNSSNTDEAKVGSNAFAHKHFHTELWLGRKKWTSLDAADQVMKKKDKDEEFKIRVACRFRPGPRSNGDVNLPLHQFLKIKRKQHLKQQADSDTNDGGSGGILVGRADPEQYTDPFLNSLMRDPVLLTTSNKVLERSVAVQCLLRNSRDPFNGRKFTQDDMVPQPELAAKIFAWKEKKQQKQKGDLNIDVSEVRVSAFFRVTSHGFHG